MTRTNREEYTIFLPVFRLALARAEKPRVRANVFRLARARAEKSHVRAAMRHARAGMRHARAEIADAASGHVPTVQREFSLCPKRVQTMSGHRPCGLHADSGPDAVRTSSGHRTES